MPKILDNKLIKEFKNRDSFSRDELLDFFNYYEPELKEGTFGWRIYDLKKRNIVKPLMRGLYAISFKKKYKPEISQDIINISQKIIDRFESVKHCIWETNWLNEFSRHQASKRIIIIEVEKDFLDSFYYELKENYKGDVFLTPDEKEINFYVAESMNPIVVKRLITRSPVIIRTENKVLIQTPSLEKIMVDIFAEDKLFYYLQGSELVYIFENAWKSYDINYAKLFGYAKRRERESDIKTFLHTNLNHLVKEIIDV